LQRQEFYADERNKLAGPIRWFVHHVRIGRRTDAISFRVSSPHVPGAILVASDSNHTGFGSRRGGAEERTGPRSSSLHSSSAHMILRPRKPLAHWHGSPHPKESLRDQPATRHSRQDFGHPRGIYSFAQTGGYVYRIVAAVDVQRVQDAGEAWVRPDQAFNKSNSC
jgi:hypothetical protein